jgi:hypothetical protein
VCLTGDQLAAVKKAGYTIEDLEDPAFFEDIACHYEDANNILVGRERLLFKQAIRKFEHSKTD